MEHGPHGRSKRVQRSTAQNAKLMPLNMIMKSGSSRVQGRAETPNHNMVAKNAKAMEKKLLACVIWITVYVRF